MIFFEAGRWVFYSDYFNDHSCSYNRATTLSLANFLKSILDLPLLFTAALLVNINVAHPFIFSFVVALAVVVLTRLPRAVVQRSEAVVE